jgi:hypothetical protein
MIECLSLQGHDDAAVALVACSHIPMFGISVGIMRHCKKNTTCDTSVIMSGSTCWSWHMATVAQSSLDEISRYLRDAVASVLHTCGFEAFGIGWQ